MKANQKSSTRYFIVAAGLFSIFLGLGLLIWQQNTIVLAFDNFFKHSLYEQQNEFLTLIFIIHTMVENLIILAVMIGVLVLVKHNWLATGWLTLNVFVTTALAAWLFKYVYQRPRPDQLHYVQETGLSFPSAHAAFATALFVTLMVIVAHRGKSLSRRVLENVTLLFFMLIICFSRVYLGVHYASDILGGMLLSSAWVIFSYPVYKQLRWHFNH